MTRRHPLDGLEREIRAHIERETEENVERGMTSAEARRLALIKFGNVALTREDTRAVWASRWLDQLRQDVRFAFRSYARTPVFTSVAVLTLALGIGANTAIFSILNGLLLRPLPVREPAQLVLVTDDEAAPRARVWNFPIWDQLRQTSQHFEAVAAWSFIRFNLSSGGETQLVEGLWATGSFFETLGVPAIVGRTFSDLDDQRGGGPDGPVAVISYGYWQRQYGGAADAIGRAVQLNTVPFTIVGVTPSDFFGPEVGRTFDFIVPLATERLIRPSDSAVDSCCTNFLSVIARLTTEQSLDSAVARLRTAQPEIREVTLRPWAAEAGQAAIDRYLESPFALVPAANGFSNLRLRYERPLLIVAVVVALVLLVACVNIASLFLARAVARRHELSVRLAVGGSRWRLTRQLLTESLLLSGVGAGIGLLFAGYGSAFLTRQLSTSTSTVFLDVSIDGRVLAFTVAVTGLTALLFGTAPALRAVRAGSTDALKEHGRATTEQAHGGLTDLLVVVQVTLSVVLVVAAGLFGRSFASLKYRELGFQPDQILVVYIDAQTVMVEPSQRVPLYERALDAVLELPGVTEAAISHVTPVGGGGFTPAVEITGDQRPGREASITLPANGEVFGNLISPRWFRTFGIPLVAGRHFTDRDRRGAQRVAIVNEMFARSFLGGDNPIGRIITLYPNTPRALSPIEIVGVVADAVYTSARDPVPPTWYLPIAQFDIPGFPFSATRLSVQATAGSPVLLTDRVETAIASVNPQLALTFRALPDQLHASLTQERLMAQLAGFFGSLALLLAGLGLYGVTAYTISRRRTEIAIRMALGAAPRAVMGRALARISLLIGVAIVVGAGISLWASRFAAGLIHGLTPRDPATLVGAALVLAVVGVLAGWLPARRATRIDPVAVLREG